MRRRKAKRRQGERDQGSEAVDQDQKPISESSVRADQENESEAVVESSGVAPGVTAREGRTLRVRTRRQVADSAG